MKKKRKEKKMSDSERKIEEEQVDTSPTDLVQSQLVSNENELLRNKVRALERKPEQTRNHLVNLEHAYLQQQHVPDVGVPRPYRYNVISNPSRNVNNWHSQQQAAPVLSQAHVQSQAPVPLQAHGQAILQAPVGSQAPDVAPVVSGAVRDSGYQQPRPQGM